VTHSSKVLRLIFKFYSISPSISTNGCSKIYLGIKRRYKRGVEEIVQRGALWSVFLLNVIRLIKSRTMKYEGWSKIFRTDALKIKKLTIRPIGRRHPRSSSLPHVDTGPTVSSISGTLPGIPFLSECQALSAFRPGSPQRYRTGVLSASVSF